MTYWSRKLTMELGLIVWSSMAAFSAPGGGALRAPRIAQGDRAVEYRRTGSRVAPVGHEIPMSFELEPFLRPRSRQSRLEWCRDDFLCPRVEVREPGIRSGL